MGYTGSTAGYSAGEQANSSRVDYAMESTFGVSPGGAYQRLRLTSENLAAQDGTATPDEINDLAEDAETILTSRSTRGSINGVLSCGTYDDFLAGVLGADWNAPPPVVLPTGALIQVSSTPANTVWVHASGGGLTPNVFKKSQIGAQITINDPVAGKTYVGFIAKISDSADVLTLASVSPAFPARTDLSPQSTITFGAITNGNLGKTFTVRKNMAGGFEQFTGCLVSQVQISLQKGQAPTVQIDVIGADLKITTVDVSSAVMPVTTSPIMDTVAGFLGCKIFGLVPAGAMQSATITLSRNGNAQDTGMGSVAAFGVQYGAFQVKMDLDCFFRDYAQFQAWQAGQKGPVSLAIADSLGNGYEFTVLNGRIWNPTNPIGGKNQTVRTTISVTGNPLPGGGTMAIRRLVNGV